MARFEPIAREIQTQYELQLRMDEMQDTKTGITLGFIFLVIVQSLGQRPLSLLQRIGVLAMFVAVVFGYAANFKSHYFRGAIIHSLLDDYGREPSADYHKLIAHSRYMALRRNLSISLYKAKYIKRMFSCFLAGVILLLSSALWGSV